MGKTWKYFLLLFALVKLATLPAAFCIDENTADLHIALEGAEMKSKEIGTEGNTEPQFQSRFIAANTLRTSFDTVHGGSYSNNPPDSINKDAMIKAHVLDEVWEKRFDEERNRREAAERNATEAWILLKAERQQKTAELIRRDHYISPLHNFADILTEAEEVDKQLPRDAYVPHVRSVRNFPDPPKKGVYTYPAISDPATDNELEEARAALEQCKPKYRIGKYFEDDQIDGLTLAYQDRGNTGDIVFSEDFVWGVERLKNREEAVFLTTIVIGHEKAHIVSYHNRYKNMQLTPEKFCSYSTREKSQVQDYRIRSCFSLAVL